jgi:Mrp family chromosome partitioning ATPase
VAIYTRAPMHEEPYEPQPVLHPSLSPEASEPARKPRVIALLNQKGGVGKTTSTVNLGAAFVRYGQRVLLVDLDPQSNLSLHFGVESGPEQRTIRLPAKFGRIERQRSHRCGRSVRTDAGALLAAAGS